MLFIVTVAFLLVGITGTVASDLAKSSINNAASAINFVTDTTLYEAELSELEPTLSRSDRLKTLKAAVGERLASLVGGGATVSVPPEPVTSVPPTEMVTRPDEPLLCPQYRPHTGLWSATNLKFEVIEGARLIFRELPSRLEIDPVSYESVLVSDRDFVLQLPLQYFRSGTEVCLPTDVVGIALDGSLIRNDESPLYRIFTDTTLIGYALDGFPIYGATTNATDNCGGHSLSGEYRYYLQRDRTNIINCFAGAPVTLP